MTQLGRVGERRLGAALLLLVSSCVLRESTLDVHVNDPSAVAVRSRGGSDAQGVMSTEGSPEKVRLSRSEIVTSATTAAAYELDVVRDRDRAIRLEWDTRLPLRLGERVTLFSTTGYLHVAMPEGPLPVSWPSGGTVRVSLCAELSPRSNRGDVSYVTSVTAALACSAASGSASVPVELEMTTETARLARRDRPERASAGLLLGLDVLVFGAVGGPLVAIGEGTNRKPLVASGASVLAVGGAFALLLAPTFFASSHDELLGTKTK